MSESHNNKTHSYGPTGLIDPMGVWSNDGRKKGPDDYLGVRIYMFVPEDVKRITEICEFPVDIISNMQRRLVGVKLKCIPKDIREKYDLEA